MWEYEKIILGQLFLKHDPCMMGLDDEGKQ